MGRARDPRRTPGAGTREPEGRQAEAGLLPGRASPEGTRRWRDRFASLPGAFRRPDRLWMSSLALGMRRGRPGGADDLLYRSAVGRCLEGGVNLFCTAPGERMQTSERALGAALRRGFAEGVAARDQVVVVTRGGELVPDPERVSTSAEAHRFLVRTYVETGLVSPQRVVNGRSLEPAFLLDQIDRSRRNLGLATLDLYLLEEPELFLRAFGPSEFRAVFADAVAALAEAARRGWIGGWGVSTWDGLLVPHSERGHLALVDLFEIALEAGGGDAFLALQLPYGLAAGEGAALASQLGPDGRSTAVLDALRDTGVAVLASAPLFGGRLVGHVPGFVARAFPEAASDALRALQFVRSTAHVTAAVVGMREPAHLEDNLALLRVPPADPGIPAELFRQARRTG